MFVLPVTSSVSRRTMTGQALDRLLDESLQRIVRGPDAAPVRTPLLDVAETDTAYTLRFDMPGATREQLDVTVEGRRVTLATQAPADTPAAEGERVLLRERTAPRYARTVVLPAEVDAASSQARFDNGVLTLSLTRRVPAGGRKISVE
jgi:HSP20 family protein